MLVGVHSMIITKDVSQIQNTVYKSNGNKIHNRLTTLIFKAFMCLYDFVAQIRSRPHTEPASLVIYDVVCTLRFCVCTE